MTNEADHTFSHMLLMSSLREMRHDIGPARQGSTPNIKWQHILFDLASHCLPSVALLENR